MLPIAPPGLRGPTKSINPDDRENKRARKGSTPETFMVLTRSSRRTYSLVGVVTLSSVGVFVPGGEATPQYLKLVEESGHASESNYVSWVVAQAKPFIGGPIALEIADFKYFGSAVGNPLTEQALQRVSTEAKMNVGTEIAQLGELVGKTLPRVFQISVKLVELLFEKRASVLVTPRGHAQHAGWLHAVKLPSVVVADSSANNAGVVRDSAGGGGRWLFIGLHIPI